MLTVKNRNKDIYTFDKIFKEESTTESIFSTSINKHLSKAIQGYNTTIMVYGVTGSGKTYTIFGNLAASGNSEPGLIQYSLQKVLEKNDSKIFISYIEIYNENVNDLLNENLPLNILEDSEGNLQIPNLKKEEIVNLEEFTKLIKKGNKLRKMGKTRVNEFSSRSHAIVQVHIRRKITNKDIKGIDTFVESKLSFVDLAGSERVGENSGKVVVEGGNINRSLLALGKVISKLSIQEQSENMGKRVKTRGNSLINDNKNNLSSFFKGGLKLDILNLQMKNNYNSNKDNFEVFIPYRDSKLTRLLKDSLGGNTKTILIACITQSQNQIEETIHSLNYAARAKRIKNKIKKNEFFESEDNGRINLIKENELASVISKLGERNGELEEKNRLLEEKLEKEKEDRIDIIKLYLEVIKALEEQYELKTSIEELKKIQEINIKKIEQKKISLENLNSNKKNNYPPKASKNELKDKLESEIRSLENIIVENDQIMKEMDMRLLTMDQKLGEWIKSCPKKFRNFEIENNVNKSLIFENENSIKQDFENSILESDVSYHPLDSRKDDDLFKKVEESVSIKVEEIPKKKDFKRNNSKNSLPLKIPKRNSKNRSRNILKENQKQMNINNQSRRSEKSIGTRQSLKSHTQRSNYRSKIRQKIAQNKGKNYDTSSRNYPIPLKKKQYVTQPQPLKIEKKFIKYENNGRNNQRFNKVKSSYQSIRTGLGATEETFGVRKIDSLLARFDKENETRKNKRRLSTKNSKKSLFNNKRNPVSHTGFSTKKSNKFRSGNNIEEKAVSKNSNTKVIKTYTNRNNYNSLLDIKRLDSSVEFNNNNESFALNTVLNDDIDDFKLELVEINSGKFNKLNSPNLIIKGLNDGKISSRYSTEENGLRGEASSLKKNALKEFISGERKRILKAYRSNHNSTSKTKLFSTTEKPRSKDINHSRSGIRSSDKYKETRSSRKKMKMLSKDKNIIAPLSKEKSTNVKVFGKRLFEETLKLDDKRKMETLVFSNSKYSEDNLSFLTHNIPIKGSSTLNPNSKNATLQSELEMCIRNSIISIENPDLETTQNLLFSSLKKSKMSKKLSKARHIKKRISNIGKFLSKNSEVIIEKKYSKIYLKLKNIYDQLQDEFFGLSENEKVNFAIVEKFLEEFKERNGEIPEEEGEEMICEENNFSETEIKF